MAMLSRFDLQSDFSQFFLILAVLLVIFTFLLARVTSSKRERRGKFTKYDDTIVDRSRELID